MSLKITEPRHTVHRESWAQFFEWPTEEGSGYSYNCAEDGTLIPDPDYPNRPDHYRDRLAEVAAGKLLAPVIKHYAWDYQQHGIGKCECGRDVGLIDGLWNFCDCGRSYSMTGQEVVPWSGPSDDTGEYMGDLYLPHDPEDVF